MESIFEIQNFMSGDVAQLARVLDWQSRGRGFEPHLLHKKTVCIKQDGFFYFSFFKSSATFSNSAYQSSPNFRISASFTNL